ncbi:trypsin-like peptidase domain-containing protein, partial [Candidatus Nomurabacteria bacterium]|nr:trypsin-like peptidase domain-containing protein [Candidatus Nomurabacteria bacterium]
MAKKIKKKKVKKPSRPNHFSTPVECVNLLKKSVYLIARGRVLDATKPEQMNWVSLGTGCVVAPNRMITAAHVINDTSSENELLQHKVGDKYYLIKHDDEGSWHYRWTELKLDKDLFIYPDVDLAVIYLDEKFYSIDGQVYVHKDDFIRIDNKFRNIATQIGVLGYPLCSLTFNNGDVNSPKVANVLLRADVGVVNCRYKTSETNHLYEFTVAFNPGNSGGPIFDVRTGQLLSIVHGYRSQSINRKEVLINEQDKQKIGVNTY